MILVVGGLASGKRTYAASLGFAPEEMAEGVLDDRPVLLNLHELVANLGPEGVDDAFVDALCEKDIITCCEVGSGIVPLDASERAWREACGRLCNRLAERATSVVRMVCGIPVTLK